MKKIVYIVTAIVGALALTGCGNFLKYHLRQDPDKAMEEYLEEKYDDDVTCLSWSVEDGFSAYWNKVNFGGTFSSKKYPGVEFTCSASLKEDGWEYRFYDRYQKVVYLAGVQEIIEEIAARYFEGTYYVVVEPAGIVDDETVDAMPFEDYIKRYLRYRVCILTEEMNDEDAIEIMQEFVTDAQSQGFQCDFYLGRANTGVLSKERYYERLVAEDYDVLWKSDLTKWLYKYELPLTEGKSEPKIYILTEEE